MTIDGVNIPMYAMLVASGLALHVLWTAFAMTLDEIFDFGFLMASAVITALSVILSAVPPPNINAPGLVAAGVLWVLLFARMIYYFRH